MNCAIKILIFDLPRRSHTAAAQARSALSGGRLAFSASIVARHVPSTDLSGLGRPSNISYMIVEGVRTGRQFPSAKRTRRS
jgi:hypothetical protein